MSSSQKDCKVEIMGTQNLSHLLYIVTSPIISSAFVILNIVCIVIFTRTFRLETLSLIMMVNICICDVLVNLISNNFYVVNLAHPTYAWTTGAVACKLFKTLTMTCNIAQIFSFVVLCLDRMRRLTHPLGNQWHMIHGRIYLAASWSITLLLTGSRYALFDEKVITRFIPASNTTRIVNYACKPVGIDTTGYTILTIAQFVIGYLLPLIAVLFALVRTEVYIIRYGILSSATREMNRQLSLTFNITALLFLMIWTPFFAMSILDLRTNLVGRKDLTHLNFSFRCTLLVFGGGKPIIYLIGLPKFRHSFKNMFCARSAASSAAGISDTDEKPSNGKSAGGTDSTAGSGITSDDMSK